MKFKTSVVNTNGTIYVRVPDDVVQHAKLKVGPNQAVFITDDDSITLRLRAVSSDDGDEESER